LSPSQRQGRQGIEGASHIEKGRVGINAHGEVNLAVPHGSLCRPWRNPALAQQRSEGVPQGVNVEDSPPVIALGNAGKAKVPIENLAQLVRNVENLGIGQPRPWLTCCATCSSCQGSILLTTLPAARIGPPPRRPSAWKGPTA
jgi:hypothetical protein